MADILPVKIGVELNLGSVAINFTGVNDDEGLAKIKKLKQQYPKDWPAHWLRRNDLHNDEKLWRKFYLEGRGNQ